MEKKQVHFALGFYSLKTNGRFETRFVFFREVPGLF